MKPVKIAMLALMGTLAFGTYNSSALAKGGPEFLKLDVSLVIQQQALNYTNKNGDGKTYVSTIDKMKVNNKALLEYMAEMFNTNWPAGARLMYSAYDEQVVVADETGTNVLFYCGAGVDDTNRYAYVNIYWYEDRGPSKGKAVEATPGSQEYTGYWRGTIDIHYENFDDEFVYIDLAGDGLNIEDYSAKMTATSYTASAKETFTPFAIGTVNELDAIMTGEIAAKGKAKYVKE
jgi:hypothetical protein